MKKKSIVVTSAMAALLLGLSWMAWTRESDASSDSERRKLAQFPELSLETVMDGSFMEQFEDYTLDQFPFRDAFRRLKTTTVLDVWRQKDYNDIYVADGYASKMIYPLNVQMLDHAASKFAFIQEKYLQDAGNVWFSIVPDKNYFLAEEHGYLALDYEELVRYMREKTGSMEYIDLTGYLQLEDYYRTDTHWRQENLVDVADALLEAMAAGREPGTSEADAGLADAAADEKAEESANAAGDDASLGAAAGDRYELQKVDLPFYGVYYGQASLPMEPDELHYLTNNVLEQCIVTHYDTGKPVPMAMYDMEKAAGRDPYEMFLSGSRAMIIIENPQAGTDQELIIFRDSFGSSLIPLLAEDYAKITILDIRYVNSAVLDQFVEFSDQDVLFLYSTLLLNDSLALK